MVVTLTGSNDFLRSQALSKLASDFVAEHTDMALEKFDGDEATTEQMRGGLQSLPFLTARKLVVLREPSHQKAFAENVADILQEIPETTDVVIVEPKLDKRLSYYKTLKKATDFRDFTELDAGGLARWATEYAREQDGSLSANDARLLIDRVGASQQLVQNELDKLLAYEPQISRQTIELLTERQPQSTIFELCDAALAGNTKHALELYREQRALKVEPQAIIAMLAWQLHVLTVVKAGSPRPADEIAREAKLNPYVVRKSQSLVRHLAMPRLKQLVGDLLTLDIRLKRTAVDADEAVQHYVLVLGDTS